MFILFQLFNKFTIVWLHYFWILCCWYFEIFLHWFVYIVCWIVNKIEKDNKKKKKNLIVNNKQGKLLYAQKHASKKAEHIECQAFLMKTFPGGQSLFEEISVFNYFWKLSAVFTTKSWHEIITKFIHNRLNKLWLTNC